MAPLSDILPISILKNKTADIVREVSESGAPVIVTQNGKAKVVVQDYETYRRWQKAMAVLKIVAQGERDVVAGRTTPQDEAFGAAEAVIRRAKRRR